MSADVIANKYRIVREIARSNDVVYEATDTTMGRRLAVKELLIPPNLTGQARRERVERFNREARATGRLSHPNIVTVYDFGEDGGRYFIAMEYLEGGTLRDTLQTRGALPVNEAVDIACQVLAALAHAHAHRVIHRDVKPDNIHILPGGQIKLTDFGIARLTEEASLTGEGQVFGTPSYMSPEQIEGRAIDHRTDLFSLAIVLYEMLAGRKPFTGDSVVSITYSIMHAEPSPLVGVPYGIEQILLRALNKDPMRRYSSAEEMRQALRSADTASPALFAPSPARTGMGFGLPTQGGSAPGGYAPSPAPFGVSVPPAGPPPGQGSTVFAPPPASAAPAPPSPAGNTGGGPFVNWGQPGATGAAAPPPIPSYGRRRAAPALSEGARTFLKVMLLAAILGGAVLGFILLFWRAYEQQKVSGTAQAVRKLMNDGKTLHNQRQYEQAAAQFEKAYSLADTQQAREDARQELVNTYNALGIRAFENRDDRTATQWWYKALDLDPNNADILYNLDRAYNRMGGQDLQDWQRAREGRVGGANPAAPGSTASIEDHLARAQKYLNDGIVAYRQGERDTARDLWTKAAGEAPGTPPAMQAQQYLDGTTAPPDF